VDLPSSQTAAMLAVSSAATVDTLEHLLRADRVDLSLFPATSWQPSLLPDCVLDTLAAALDNGHPCIDSVSEPWRVAREFRIQVVWCTRRVEKEKTLLGAWGD
jgi:hypothetical protein